MRTRSVISDTLAQFICSVLLLAMENVSDEMKIVDINDLEMLLRAVLYAVPFFGNTKFVWKFI
jgi:hypothetical protein